MESELKPVSRQVRYEIIDVLNDLNNQVYDATQNNEFRDKFKTALRMMNDI